MNTKMIVRFYQVRFNQIVVCDENIHKISIDRAKKFLARTTVKPHQPLIQFRHGVPVINKSESTPSPSTVGAVQTMEDYQLPKKFKRVMMDDAEINAINSGGAE